MRRRHFLTSGSIPLLGLINCAFPRRISATGTGEGLCSDIYPSLVRANDAQVSLQLARQERRASHPRVGGLPDGDGIYTAGAAAGFVKTLAAAFSAPESRYAGSEELLPCMEQAVHFLRSVQHPDGTIDLHTTNFHSPPDTAFVVEPLAVSMAVLQSQKKPGLKKLLEELRSFLAAAGKALAVGGIHTPNHRWVVCSALARLNSLDPRPQYVSRIDDWLGEGVDIDPDGQFAERSTSIYSPVTDFALVTTAKLLNRPNLLEPVRRNLTMTLYYLHGDGGVATEGSRRQDQYTRGSTAGYHIPYRYLAIRDGNGHFAAVTRKIEAIACERLGGNLIYFLEDPQLKKALPASEPLPENFARLFTHSNLARIRRGPVSATILGANPILFSFHKAGAALEGLRLASAFFGKGQFQGSSMEMDAGRYKLRQILSGPYYQPLPAEARRADGDWSLMDIGRRPKSEVQNLQSQVTITESGGSFEVEFEIIGCEGVPLAVELGFRRGGKLSGVIPIEEKADCYLLREGMARYEFDGQAIEFGPGQAEHRYIQLRGALPKLDAMSVYLTGFTPFRKQIVIA